MKCTHIKSQGDICKAFAMKWSSFCYLHNPEISKEEKRIAQSKWWKSWFKKASNIKTPPLVIKDVGDISELLIDTVHQVRSWDMEVKTANCIGFLCNHLMKAYELSTLEAKLDHIKQSLSS